MTWLGIAFCLSQSAMFSGLNLAFFSVGRLDLEIQARADPKARRVLAIREDSNHLLTTILWGNVAINVLLTLLTDSVMAGALAFVVSTTLITFFGEIAPQAYFSRNPLRMAALLSPILLGYRFLLYPLAKPCARMLDWWLGRESPTFLREHAVREFLLRHAGADETDLEHLESRGAVNFLDLDDVRVADIAPEVDPASVLALPVVIDLPRFPAIDRRADDPFLVRLAASGRKWAVVTDPDAQPRLVVDADSFIRSALYDEAFDPYAYCHRPAILPDGDMSAAAAIRAMARGVAEDRADIECDVVLVWASSPRILTGADILRRLLSGV